MEILVPVSDSLNNLPVENGEGHFSDELRLLVVPGLLIVHRLELLVQNACLYTLYVIRVL
jgi:hypothetical protein